MMNVMEKLCWTTSRLANSTRGMRWPRPGVGTMATCGGLISLWWSLRWSLLLQWLWVSNAMVALGILVFDEMNVGKKKNIYKENCGE